MNKKMKPLRSARRAFYWMSVHFADDSPTVNWQQKYAQKIFSTVFAMILIATATLHVKTLFELRFINAEEFFLVLLQFVMMIHGFSAFITIYLFSSRISIVFQSLTQICEKRKENDFKFVLFNIVKYSQNIKIQPNF